ncbi:hypothetical protein HZH66_000370 [Vespula vulgaris]|uniref:Uncharacterized protein n=1 Tax=Vespula vulgaris TaxID=7454 RepID=A0A834KNZ5_VESVU|nr:hypothetical protein HZH66_000370 [Vespula vulgaris]
MARVRMSHRLKSIMIIMAEASQWKGVCRPNGIHGTVFAAIFLRRSATSGTRFCERSSRSISCKTDSKNVSFRDFNGTYPTR